ncbi:MAG TPA: lipoprotein [SAR86 cluster bacterium]|nr:lipoprotein [SAR86 cluster bacterium]
MKSSLLTLTIISLIVSTTACGNKTPLDLPSESVIGLSIYGRI